MKALTKGTICRLRSLLEDITPEFRKLRQLLEAQNKLERLVHLSVSGDTHAKGELIRELRRRGIDMNGDRPAVPLDRDGLLRYKNNMKWISETIPDVLQVFGWNPKWSGYDVTRRVLSWEVDLSDLDDEDQDEIDIAYQDAALTADVESETEDKIEVLEDVKADLPEDWIEATTNGREITLFTDDQTREFSSHGQRVPKHLRSMYRVEAIIRRADKQPFTKPEIIALGAFAHIPVSSLRSASLID